MNKTTLFNLKKLDKSDPEHLADVVSRIIAPDCFPIDSEGMLNAVGIDVQFSDHKNIQGQVVYYNSIKQTIVMNGIYKNTKMYRFALAHCLGRLIMFADEDFWLPIESSGITVCELEKKANKFAAEMLMPKWFLESSIQKFSKKELMDLLGVSKNAITWKTAAFL